MKKSIIIVLSLFSLNIMTAQKKKTKQSSTKPSLPLSFGVKAGGGLHKISNNDELRNLKSKIGFYGGLFTNYAISKKASVQLEALYQHFGVNIDYKQDTRVKGYAQLSHINIPLDFQYRIIPQLYAETGPEINIVIKTQEVITDKAGYNLADKSDWKEYTKGTFFGWNFGLGYFLTENISANARFSLGLNTPYKDYVAPNGEKRYATKFRTSNLQVGLAYKF